METQLESWSTEDIAEAICRSYTGEIYDETLEVRVPDSTRHIGNVATGASYAA